METVSMKYLHYLQIIFGIYISDITFIWCDLLKKLQVFNHLGVEMRIFCRSEELVSSGATSPTPTNGEFTELRVMAPEESWDVPLYVAYHCQLFFTPAGQG